METEKLVNLLKNTDAVVGGESVRSRTVRRGREEIRGMGEAADREAYYVHTVNIISQRQYIVGCCLISYVDNVFGLHSMCVCFPSTRKLVSYAKRTDSLQLWY
jgi:hypothetical protein